MKKLLTARQREIFEYVRACCVLKYPPTLAEIGKRFGFSTKAAFDHLRAIEKKGYIQLNPGIPRSILILKDEQPACLTYEITPKIVIRRLKDFRVGDFIRVQRQNFGCRGDVVFIEKDGSLILTRLFGELSETEAAATKVKVIGKVIGRTFALETLL